MWFGVSTPSQCRTYVVNPTELVKKDIATALGGSLSLGGLN